MQAPLGPDTPPAPDQDSLPEQGQAKLQPIETRHVPAGIASHKMNRLRHGRSLAQVSRGTVQLPGVMRHAERAVQARMAK